MYMYIFNTRVTYVIKMKKKKFRSVRTTKWPFHVELLASIRTS